MNKSDISNFYSLTHPQKRIWYTEQFYTGTTVGNIIFLSTFKENIDYQTFNQAINIIIYKNDALRLKITKGNDGEPIQYVSKFNEKHIEFIDFCEKSNPQKEFENWIMEQSGRSFNIIENDLFEIFLIKLRENEFVCYMKFHHLIYDGSSGVLFIKWIREYYQMLKTGAEIDMSLSPSYTEYIESENKYKGSEKFVEDKLFWQKKYENLSATIIGNTDKIFTNSIKSTRRTFTFPETLRTEIYKFCKHNQISIFRFLFSVIYLVLTKLQDRKDINIKIVTYGRRNNREKEMIGMFVNTVPIYLNSEDNIDIVSLIKMVDKELSEAISHDAYPYDLLISDLREKKIINGDIKDISNISVVYNKGDIVHEYLPNESEPDAIVFRLNPALKDSIGQLELAIDYQIELFKEEEIEKIYGYITNISKKIIEYPNKRLSNIEMISEEEKYKLLYKFNNTYVDYPRNKTIHQLFEEQAKKTPDNIAVIFEQNGITYRELDERSNLVAAMLRDKGVVLDSIVAIIVDRSIEMIVGILGILKSGGAYLPIDPDYPEDRIRFMLEDSGANILLEKKDLTNCESYKCNSHEADIHIISSSNNLAYIIYTSGSTGVPKGVMIEHKSAVNQIMGFNKMFECNEELNYVLTYRYTFDASVENIFCPLVSGGKLFIVSQEEMNDIARFKRFIEINRISILDSTPTFIESLLEYSPEKLKIKYIIVSADVFSKKLYDIIQKNCVFEMLMNAYGPTEATVNTTVYKCKDSQLKSDTVPIGKPLQNYSIYILDKEQNVLPIGIAGELYIGGEGLARGYLNRSELTAEKFVPNPFVQGARMYRTGDLARWLPDGNIEFLGRIDNQVKIRGFRIELGEIEAELVKHECVKEAVVVAKEDLAGMKYLCAYVVANNDKKLLMQELRSHLSKVLADYMVPSYFVQLSSLPLTQNGKINRKALPEPDGSMNTGVEFVNAKTKTQELLLDIWKSVINTEIEFGIDDNFFDIGGNSIIAIRVARAIKEHMKLNIPVAKLFQYPTINSFAKYIDV